VAISLINYIEYNQERLGPVAKQLAHNCLRPLYEIDMRQIQYNNYESLI